MINIVPSAARRTDETERSVCVFTGYWTNYPAEAPFQVGYLCHALITYLSEIAVRDQVAFDLIAGFVRWNMQYAQYGYYTAYNQVQTVHDYNDSTSMAICDAVAWYMMNGGSDAARVQMVQYMTTGINGGGRPYVDLGMWRGDHLGRLVTQLRLLRGGTL